MTGVKLSGDWVAGGVDNLMSWDSHGDLHQQEQRALSY